MNFIDTSLITDFNKLFDGCSRFNGDISKWNTSNITCMNWTFYKCKFNGDISNWDVSKVKTMNNMFKDSPLEDNEPDWYKD